MSRLSAFFAFSVLSMFAFSASAMNSVTNLDEDSHTLLIESIGGAVRAVAIPPGQTTRFNEYRAHLALQGQEERVQPMRMGDQFVIWGDGKLRLQRRQNQRFDN